MVPLLLRLLSVYLWLQVLRRRLWLLLLGMGAAGLLLLLLGCLLLAYALRQAG